MAADPRYERTAAAGDGLAGRRGWEDPRPVLWSAWGHDWTAEATAASVLAAVRRDLRGGGTVLLHDSDRTAAPGCWRSALGAAPGLVAGCREAGWAVGPLGEHWHQGRYRPVRCQRSFEPNEAGSCPDSGLYVVIRGKRRGRNERKA